MSYESPYDAEVTPQGTQQTSDEAIYSWRWARLWDAGYDSRLCEYFGERFELDLHTLIDAKQAGMTDVQALKIFGG